MTRNRGRDASGVPPVTTDRPDLSFTAFHQMNRASYVRYAETYLRHRQDAEECSSCDYLRPSGVGQACGGIPFVGDVFAVLPDF
ncbi:hypothetical protein ACH4VQ_36230 [Streptomyces anulatus]